jgi:uncharacterized protein (TIGR02172 family)
LTREEIVGIGRTAEIIRITKDKILKLSRRSFQRDHVEYEYKLCRIIQEKIRNVPKTYDLIEKKDRLGIVFEYIEGPTMAEKIMKNPFRLRKEIRDLVDLHLEIHKINGEGLPSLEEKIANRISRTDKLNGKEKSQLLKKVTKMETEQILLHGDFHPGNIICTPSRKVIIDWIDAAKGNRVYDVARSYYLMKNASQIGMNIISKILLKILGTIAANIYLRNYCKKTNLTKKEVKDYLLLIYAVRLEENIPSERKRLVRRIKQLLNKKLE